MIRDLPLSVQQFNLPSDVPTSFRSTGLPDDFDLFMADVYEGDADLTDAELCDLYERECNRLLAEQLAFGGYRLPRVTIPFLPLTLVA